MSNIEIKKIVKSIETSDGAGVKLKRSIGTPEANYIDPFIVETYLKDTKRFTRTFQRATTKEEYSEKYLELLRSH